MVVYSAFIPYLPISPRTEDFEHKNKVKKTLLALDEVKKELYATQPKTIILISSHEDMGTNFFSVFVNENIKTSYSAIGDFESHRTMDLDLRLTQKIKESCVNRQPLITLNSKLLSYPMSFAVDQLIPIGMKYFLVPISPSWHEAESQLQFGAILRDVCEESEDRIAVLVVGNLSQCLSKKSPARYHADGKKYDEAVKKAFKSGNLMEITKIKTGLVNNSSNNSHNQLLILAGFMQEMQISPKILSYETPFGIGYLTATLWR